MDLEYDGTLSDLAAHVSSLAQTVLGIGMGCSVLVSRLESMVDHLGESVAFDEFRDSLPENLFNIESEVTTELNRILDEIDAEINQDK